jgi:UDP-N-acetyl-D-glucosamine dehydrogenase
VYGADPHVVETTPVEGLVRRVDATPDELAAADVVVLLTDHDQFDLAEVTEHARLVLDCRRRLTGPQIERL